MHRVFISFYHYNDDKYKQELLRQNVLYGGLFEDHSVDTGQIDDTDKDDQRIREIIRDDYLPNTSVTMLLVGANTGRRQHCDWEIASSMFDGTKNKRSGILVVCLPGAGDLASGIHKSVQPTVFPEVTGWKPMGGREDCTDRYPTMPPRIIDNLCDATAPIIVVPWSRIDNLPDNLELLIDETFSHSRDGEYNHSRPMMRGNNENYLMSCPRT